MSQTRYVGFSDLTHMMDPLEDGNDPFNDIVDLVNELASEDEWRELELPIRPQLDILADIMRQLCYLTRMHEVNPRGVELKCLQDLMERNGKAYGRLPE